jgi:iduronate 2-sulfatase
MRRTFFGPLMADTEAQLAREHGDRWEPALFAEHLMGYSLRTDRYRLTLWVDRRHPEAEPFAVELYDHQCDPRETVNLANRPEHQATIAALRQIP